MSKKLQIRRGSQANLPTLANGEPAFTTDTHRLYVGGISGNVLVAGPDMLSGKADKAVAVSATLTASGWTGGSSPYTQTVSIDGIEVDSGIVIVGISNTAGADARWVAGQANLRVTERATGSITITTEGKKPGCDIPITIVIADGETGIVDTFTVGDSDSLWETVEITTSQTWTVPDGVTEIDVTCVGGGAGGSSGANSTPGGGGGSGYINRKKLTVIPGTEYLVTIGTAGAVASNGGNTSFGNELVANGGLAPNGKQGGNGEAGGGAGAAYADTSITRMGGQGQNGGAGGFAQSASSQPGKGTDTAKGGNNAAHAGGGGAGVNGGDGGDGLNRSNYGLGGGAGGYGSDRLTASTRSGKGYGAGGGGYDAGAPGICIIKYRKAVMA